MSARWIVVAGVVAGWVLSLTNAAVAAEAEELAQLSSVRVSNRGGELWRALLQRERAVEALAKALERQPDVNAQNPDGNTPLTAVAYIPVAAQQRAAMLLQAGADPNGADKHGNTPVSYALVRGNPALLVTLLRAGARVEQVAAGRYSAVQVALRYDRIDEVPLLLAAGARAGDTLDGWGVAHAAARLGKMAMIRDVQALRPLVDARGPGGVTPLIVAARIGRAHLVQGALEAGAAVDLPDDRGRTALMTAMLGRFGEAARALLAAGADPNLRSQSGETAFVLAGRRGDRSLQQLLLEHGAVAEPVYLEEEAGRALDLPLERRRALVLAALELQVEGFSLGALAGIDGERERAERWLRGVRLATKEALAEELARLRADAVAAGMPKLSEAEMRAKEEELLTDPAALVAWKAQLQVPEGAPRVAAWSRRSFLVVLGARAGWMGEEEAWTALAEAERSTGREQMSWTEIGAAIRARVSASGRSDPARAIEHEKLLVDEASPTALWRLSPWR